MQILIAPCQHEQQRDQEQIMLFLPPPALPLLSRHSRIPHHMTPSMTTPKAVKHSKVLVVGGGPTGSVAAAHLHKRGISATLVEKQSDFTDFDVAKAYCMRLDYRAGRVIDQVDGMFQHLSRSVESTRRRVLRTTLSNGKTVARDIGAALHELPDLCDLRPSIVDSLKQFVAHLDGLDAHYGVEVKDIHVADNGWMTVTMDSPDGDIVHNTRLILACDGRNSTVGRLLEQAQSRGQPVHALNGHGVESHDSPAVGLSVKSILLNEEVINKLVGTRDRGEFIVRSMSGDGRRGFGDIFKVSIFPISREYTSRVGGLVGSMVRQSEHNLWQLKDTESGYDFFQANFPQLDVRKAISEREMRRFVDSEPLRLGDIRRRKSLAVKTGKVTDGGAVVFLGDSAHAFPPDIGQGVCAALGDVGVFMEILDKASEEDGLMDMMLRYDEERGDEAKALMKLSKFGAPYQYAVYEFGHRFWTLNYQVRWVLSTWLPGVFWPQMMVMLKEDITYREIVRRGDVTTNRLALGGAVLVAAVAVLVAQIGFR